MIRNVYHYTSPEGIFSILKNKTLWFTDCRYDMGEFEYIRKPFLEANSKVNNEHGKTDNEYDYFLDNEHNDSFADNVCLNIPYEDYEIEAQSERGGHSQYCETFEEYRYYVLCTSCEPDSSSMWNYYVKNGEYRGYNLCLDIDVINSFFSVCENDNIQFIHGHVLYNKRQQVELIYNRMKELLTDLHRHSPFDCKARDMYHNKLAAFIDEKRLFFKPSAFSNEKEYRFIIKIRSDYKANGDLETKFRVGSSGIITPYVEWKFDTFKQDLLKQITLSPMIEEKLAKESFRRFLREDVYSNISIVPSSIKLRY